MLRRDNTEAPMSRIDQLQARLDWMHEHYTTANRWAILKLADEIMEELRVAAGLPECCPTRRSELAQRILGATANVGPGESVKLKLYSGMSPAVVREYRGEEPVDQEDA